MSKTQHTAPVEERSLPAPEQDLHAQRRERVAARAFELYEARGGEYGLDRDDWLQAEQQIDFEIAQRERLWQITLPDSVQAGPISYAVNGRQYVAVMAGNTLFSFALRP